MDKDSFWLKLLAARDPLGFQIIDYLWAIATSCVGGIIKHLNQMKAFHWKKFVVDLIICGLTGILTFWACDYLGIKGSASALTIAVGGMMGNRVGNMMEARVKALLGGPGQ